jgi:hypothetical protein
MRPTGFALLLLILAACGSRIDLSESAVEWPRDAGPEAAAPVDAAPEAADADAGDMRIIPLQSGRKWTFVVDGAKGCAAGTAEASVLGETTVDNQAALRYKPICDPDPVDVVGSGDRLIAYSTDGSNVSWLWMDTPVEDGHTWEVTKGLHATWTRVGRVAVWAGTFDDCYRRDEPEATAPTWVIYCRGVGPVKYNIESEGWQAELVGKNF